MSLIGHPGPNTRTHLYLSIYHPHRRLPLVYLIVLVTLIINSLTRILDRKPRVDARPVDVAPGHRIPRRWVQERLVHRLQSTRRLLRFRQQLQGIQTGVGIGGGAWGGRGGV